MTQPLASAELLEAHVIKLDIVNAVVTTTNISRTKAEQAVETVFESLKSALGRGQRIELRRFGVFRDRKSTRLNSSHANISYAVFCLKKKQKSHSSAITKHRRCGTESHRQPHRRGRGPALDLPGAARPWCGDDPRSRCLRNQYRDGRR